MTQDPHDPTTWADGEVLDGELITLGAAVDAVLLTRGTDDVAAVELRLVAEDGTVTAYLPLALAETVTDALRDAIRTARAMQRAHRRGARK
jgi:hypothetical protein